jgi:hypothetical protein
MKFTALNPDNLVECRAVGKLFNSIYGADPVMAPLSHDRFWHDHSGTHLTSIIAREAGKVVAHFALCSDPLFATNGSMPPDLSRLSVKYAALAPHLHERAEELGAAAGALVRTLARRRSVSVLESFLLSSSESQSHFSTSILGPRAVRAVLPGFATVGERTTPLVISQVRFSSSGAEITSSPPTWLNALEWKGNSVSQVTSTFGRRPSHTTGAVPNLRFSPHTRNGFLLIDKLPNDLPSYLNGHDAEPPAYVLVNQSEAGSLAAAQLLINHGFQPTGAIFQVEGAERAVFTRITIEHDLLFSEQARNLVSAKGPRGVAIAVPSAPTMGTTTADLVAALRSLTR